MYQAVQAKIRAIHDDVLVSNMEFGEIVTQGGIVLRSDDGKVHGVKPRWAQVYCVGPDQHDFKAGDWILIEHGRWSRKIKIDDGVSEVDVQKVDVECILAVSESRPSLDYIGQEA